MSIQLTLYPKLTMYEIDTENYDIFTPMPKGRLVIGLVSPGKMGVLATQALVSMGHILGFGYHHSAQSVARLKQYFPEAAATDLAEIVLLSDLIIIAVPEVDTQQTLQNIVALANSNSIILVISRITGENLLADLPARRPHVMCVYPLLNVDEEDPSPADLRGTHWIITAYSEIENVIAQSLVMEIGAIPVPISPEFFPDFSQTILQFTEKITQICQSTKMDIYSLMCNSNILNHGDTIDSSVNLEREIMQNVVNTGSDRALAEEVMLPFITEAVAIAFKRNLPYDKFPL